MTTDTRYKIIFFGRVREGFDGVTVRQRLASLYKANPKQIESLFSGRRMVLKSGLSREAAEQFRRLFEETGAACEVLPENLDAAATPVPPAQPASRPAAPTPSNLEPRPHQVPYTRATPAKRKRPHPLLWVLGVLAVLMILYVLMLNLPVKGMRRAAAESNRGIPAYSGRWVSVNDPSGYYSLELPPGFSMSPVSAGTRSRITYTYSSDLTLTIEAAPATRTWDPDQELQKLILAVQQGREPGFNAFTVGRSAPIQLAEADGFQLTLQKNDTLARTIHLLNNRNILFRIDILARGKANHPMLEQLTKATIERMDMR